MTLTNSNGKPVMKKPTIAVVNANSVYLPLAESMPDLATYTISEDDITAVKEIRNEELEIRNDGQSTYDLHGRKVTNTVKGNIYIQNHRKILVK